MNGHPGGAEHTRHMLELADLPAGAGVLDMGAGAGEAVALLNSLGRRAEGIDLRPRTDRIREGDFLSAPYPDESFDAVLSQCAFFVSGDPEGALREARRLLKPGGKLLLSDVEFAPLRPMAEEAGFRILFDEDLSAAWKEYYIEALWRGETCDCELPKRKCGYRLLIAEKEK